MPIDITAAPAFALLAMYAEDMHRDADSGARILKPVVDDRLAPEWETVAYLTANDPILPAKAHLQIGPQRLYYGFVARSTLTADTWVVAVRGTSGVVEWIIDGQFFYAADPRGPGLEVEQGFWGIYSTMSLEPLDGSPVVSDAALGIAGLVGAGSVTVVGHSLGSALATYLSYDLERHLGAKVSAFLFASPRTGNQAWVQIYHAALGDRYVVINYLLDLVPRLPARPQYATLPNALILRPSSAEAAIRVDVLSDHHVLCYCAMLSLATAQAAKLDVVDMDARNCILGGPDQVQAAAKLLEAALDGVDEAGLSGAEFFRTIIGFGS